MSYAIPMNGRNQKQNECNEEHKIFLPKRKREMAPWHDNSEIEHGVERRKEGSERRRNIKN